MTNRRWYPNVKDQATNNALRVAFDHLYTLGETARTLAAQAKDMSVSVARTAASQVQTAQALLTTLPGYDFFQIGSTSQVRQGNATVLPILNGSIKYDNATANVIKWYTTGLQLFWPDRVIDTVPDTTVGSPLISVSGLVAGTTYTFYPRWNADKRVAEFVIGIDPAAVGTPAAAYPVAGSFLAAQAQNADGFVSLSAGIAAAATGGGGGGGSGGGGGGHPPGKL